MTTALTPRRRLEVIEQADRAALYQALGLTVFYRRVGTL
jgi:hypothetical protein